MINTMVVAAAANSLDATIINVFKWLLPLVGLIVASILLVKAIMALMKQDAKGAAKMGAFGAGALVAGIAGFGIMAAVSTAVIDTAPTVIGDTSITGGINDGSGAWNDLKGKVK
jgi:hypothetical protein